MYNQQIKEYINEYLQACLNDTLSKYGISTQKRDKMAKELIKNESIQKARQLIQVVIQKTTSNSAIDVLNVEKQDILFTLDILQVKLTELNKRKSSHKTWQGRHKSAVLKCQNAIQLAYRNLHEVETKIASEEDRKPSLSDVWQGIKSLEVNDNE